MKEIIITIKDGQTKVETKGYSGPECMDASKDYEAVLDVKRVKKTAEYYETGKVESSKKAGIK